MQRTVTCCQRCRTLYCRNNRYAIILWPNQGHHPIRYYDRTDIGISHCLLAATLQMWTKALMYPATREKQSLFLQTDTDISTQNTDVGHLLFPQVPPLFFLFKHAIITSLCSRAVSDYLLAGRWQWMCKDMIWRERYDMIHHAVVITSAPVNRMKC